MGVFIYSKGTEVRGRKRAQSAKNEGLPLYFIPFLRREKRVLIMIFEGLFCVIMAYKPCVNCGL